MFVSFWLIEQHAYLNSSHLLHIQVAKNYREPSAKNLLLGFRSCIRGNTRKFKKVTVSIRQIYLQCPYILKVFDVCLSPR